MKYNRWVARLNYPSNLLNEIIKARGIKDRETFLNPDYNSLSSSGVLKSLPEASLIIKDAIKNVEKIGVFCDYDADGICAGAIIYRVIKSLKGEVTYYIPERKEGYGFSSKAVDFFIKQKVKLVIMLDCGIKSHEEVLLLKGASIKSIIADHHQLPAELPKADAIVHPMLTNNKTNLDLSGGGTAYMLAKKLLGESGREKWLIDLAAISSVADVVPLTGDNRILVKYGLLVLEKTKNKGLIELLKSAKIVDKKLTVYDLGFVIAPRLNAAGRIAHPRDSFELLVGENIQENKKIANKLNDLNNTRQELLLHSVEKAIEMIEKLRLGKKNIIVVKGDFEEGIVGLIASRVCEKYYRPTIVLSTKGDKLKGSARSIDKINITNLIGECGEYLLSSGGHAMAAGLSLSKNNYENFKKKIEKISREFPKHYYERILKVDAMVRISDLRVESIEQLEKLAPFGMGNPRPIFAIEKCEITRIDTIGKNADHQKIYFKSNEIDSSCLIFNFEQKEININSADKVDIAFNASINSFNGRKSVDLIIEDVKKSR
ncbi:MAG: single-stranded-DNA-specific exonuclease RecJ [bacterium]